MKFVAVTSCPTGIAHTYMAAEALEQAAVDAGDEMTVETQGSAGSDPLDPQVIADADAVIFAADVEVRDRERFAGKPLVQSGVKRAIGRAAQMLEEARAAVRLGLRPALPPAPRGRRGRRRPGDQGQRGRRVRLQAPPVADDRRDLRHPVRRRGRPADRAGLRARWLRDHRRAEVTEGFNWGSLQSWAALMFQIGGVAFGFLVPILAGFIAFAMADRPALVPGIVGGYIAGRGRGPGFLGGLAAGLIAGGVVFIRKVKVPRSVAGIMPVVVIPLISTLIVGALMFVVIGPPLGAPDHRPDRLAQRALRHQPDAAGHPARAHDGLRHGRPDQQDRLRVRGRRALHRDATRASRSWPR